MNSLSFEQRLHCTRCIGYKLLSPPVIYDFSCAKCGNPGVSFFNGKKICPNHLIPCPKCECQVSLASLHTHYATDCERSSHVCKFCDETFPDYDKLTHFNHCANAYIECPDCLAVLQRKALSSHKEHYCSHSDKRAMTTCKICEASVPVVSFQSHYETVHLGRQKSVLRSN